MASESQKKKLCFFGILFWLYVIFVIAWTLFGTTWIDLFPPKDYHRGGARIKACMSNCRVLMGAIEMYDMDHDNKYPSCELPVDPSPELRGYHKHITKPIDKCNYLYNATTTTVYCVCHGSPEHPYDLRDVDIKLDFHKNLTDEDFKKLNELHKKESGKKRVREYISSLPSRFWCGLVLPFFFVIVLPFLLLGKFS